MRFYNSNGNPHGDAFIKSINHRGYGDAPENTLPAYKMSWENGFRYVECDVALTAEGVPVLLHDNTIDRTSNGTGAIADLTLEAVRAFDFGSWKSAEYAGTKIPTFEEFIKLCRGLNLHPYIEIKDTAIYTNEQLQGLVDLVNANGMKGNVTWISFSLDYLNVIKAYDAAARLGYLSWSLGNSAVDATKTLKTDENEVFLNVTYTVVNDDLLNYAIAQGVPVECWNTPYVAEQRGTNEEDVIASANPYISGYTTDTVHAGKALFDNAISGE